MKFEENKNKTLYRGREQIKSIFRNDKQKHKRKMYKIDKITTKTTQN